MICGFFNRKWNWNEKLVFPICVSNLFHFPKSPIFIHWLNTGEWIFIIFYNSLEIKTNEIFLSNTWRQSSQFKSYQFRSYQNQTSQNHLYDIKILIFSIAISHHHYEEKYWAICDNKKNSDCVCQLVTYWLVNKLH